MNYKEIKQLIKQNEKSLFENVSEKELKQYQRWDWYWSTRIDKHGSMKTATHAMNKFIKDKMQNSTTLKSAQYVWKQEGPWNNTLSDEGRMGRANVVWADASDVNTILVGTHGNGLWKSSNGGVNWVRLNPDMPGGCTDIAVDPYNHNIIYITTGVWTSGWDKRNYATGIWKTTDGGVNWVQLGGGLDLTYARKIILNEKTPGVVYVLTENKVYRSTNNGLNWIEVLEAQPGQRFMDIKQNPNDKYYFYVAGYNTFYYTYDNGTHWVNQSTTIDTSGTWKFTVDCSTDGILYGFLYKYSGTSTYMKIFRSINSYNINWSMYSVSYPNCHQNIDIVLEALPAGEIFIGAVDFQSKYVFNGNGFTRYPLLNLHPDLRGFCFPNNNSSIIYLVTDGGVHKNISSNGLSFTQVNGNLSTNEVYDVAINENDPDLYLIGCHDNGTMLNKDGKPWSYVAWGDGGNCMITPNDTSRQYWLSNGHMSSTKGNTNLTGSTYTFPIEISNSQPNIVYSVGWDNVLAKATIVKSTNYGITFDFDNYIGNEWNAISAVGVSPTDANTIYFSTWPKWGGTYGRLKKTTDGGSSWQYIESGMASLGDAPVTQIIFDRTNSNNVWVSFGGFGVIHIYKSTNGGGNWSDISFNLPDFPVNSIIYDDERNTLYAATDVGVYKLADGSTNWVEFNSGMPMLVVTKLRLNYTTNKLIASTYGGGVWSCPLARVYDDTNPGFELPGVKSGKNSNFGFEPITENQCISLSIYPNPVANVSKIEVSGPVKKETKLIVYTLNGQKVKEYDLLSKIIMINNKEFNPGTYILLIQQDGKTYVDKKFIVI